MIHFINKVKNISGIKLFLGIMSLMGVFLILLSTSRYGVGISADSVAYISAARNVLAGKGYLHYDGTSFVGYPPLFSTLLAFMGLSGFDMLEVVRYVNAVIFGLIIFISGLWLLENIKYRPLIFFGLAAILLSVPLLQVSVHAWSEPSFVLFTLFSIFAIEQYFKKGSYPAFFISAIFASLAYLTRYVGVTVILTVLVLTLFNRNKKFSRKIIDATIFGFISILPMMVWLARVSEQRFPSSASSFAQNLYLTLDNITLWFLPSSISSIPRISTITSLSIFTISILIWVWRHSQNNWRAQYLEHIAALGCFLFIYTASLIIIAAYLAIESIGDRFLSPIFVPLMLLIFFTLDYIRQFYNKYFSKKTINIFLIFLISFWLIYPFLRMAKNIRYCLKFGSGEYSSSLWRESDLIHYLIENPLDGYIYSNAPDAIYILTGRSATISPRKYQYNYRNPPPELSKFKKYLTKNNSAFLVWFKNKRRDYLYNIEELRSIFKMEVVAIRSDGDIYIIK